MYFCIFWSGKGVKIPPETLVKVLSLPVLSAVLYWLTYKFVIWTEESMTAGYDVSNITLLHAVGYRDWHALTILDHSALANLWRDLIFECFNLMSLPHNPNHFSQPQREAVDPIIKIKSKINEQNFLGVHTTSPFFVSTIFLLQVKLERKWFLDGAPTPTSGSQKAGRQENNASGLSTELSGPTWGRRAWRTKWITVGAITIYHANCEIHYKDYI